MKRVDACIGMLFIVAMIAFSGVDGDYQMMCAAVGLASLIIAGVMSIFRAGDWYDAE